MKVEKIDHICIAVKDLEKAQETYEKILGIKLDCVYIAEKEKIKVGSNPDPGLQPDIADIRSQIVNGDK